MPQTAATSGRVAPVGSSAWPTEQTILVHTTAGRTQMGWLHAAMLTRQPYTLSVFIRALDRRRERQRLKLAYRRLFTINRGAEQRGRVPDFDRYVQEREYEGLLGELAGGEQAGIYRVAVYQTLRVRGPDPDATALAEAVDYCAEQIPRRRRHRHARRRPRRPPRAAPRPLAAP